MLGFGCFLGFLEGRFLLGIWTMDFRGFVRSWKFFGLRFFALGTSSLGWVYAYPTFAGVFFIVNMGSTT